MRLFPYSTLLGLLLMGAVMITTYFTDAFKMTLVFGVPFLVILSIVYGLFFRKAKSISLSAQSLKQGSGITGQASE
jgi:L-asparagine transporter-like permease